MSQMQHVPPYLAPPAAHAKPFGTLSYDADSDSYLVKAEPFVVETCKRIFPGSSSKAGQRGRLRFPATRRNVADLAWLMTRYPLSIACPERFEQDRLAAVEHAQRRERNRSPARVALPPTFKGTLRPYQQEDVEFLLANERSLLAAEMGLGKTVSALAALAAAQGWPALVVVPPNLRLQWREMAGTFLDLPPTPSSAAQRRLDLAPLDAVHEDAPGAAFCHIVKGRTPYKLPPAPITIIHYGLLADWKDALLARGFKAIVYDEMQELRHHETKKYSVASLISGRARYVWGLSGTPTYNYADEIWALMNVLEYHCLGDRDSFTREWCVGYGRREVEQPEVLGDYLRGEGLLLRRRKQDKDVAQHLPPKRRVVQKVESDARIFNELVGHARKLIDEYETLKGWQEKGRAAREIEADIRQATGIAKAPSVAAFVAGLVEAGERVILCAHHHKVYDIYMEGLARYNPVRLTGHETPAEKHENLRRFQSGESQVVLLALRGAAGIDGLQKRASCIVFGELDWSPSVHAQAEDRIQRIGVDGALESILCYYLVSGDGFDETMQEALGLKVAQFTTLMGDKAETEEDKMLAQRAAERHMDKIIQSLKNKVARPQEVPEHA